MFLRIAVLILILTLFLIPSGKTQSDWELKKVQGGISVYYREDPQSDIKELKVTMTIQSSLSSAISVINDIPNMPSWVFQCKEAKIIDQKSESSFSFFNRTVFPIWVRWLFSDRVSVYDCSTTQDQNTLETCSRCQTSPDTLPLDKDYIRVEQSTSVWTLIPDSINKDVLHVKYYLLADPGGSIPARIVNWGLDIGPIKSMKGLRKMVQQNPYKHASLSYITEP